MFWLRNKKNDFMIGTFKGLYVYVTRNVLKLQTLFSFSSQLNVGYQGWNQLNACYNSKHGRLRSAGFIRCQLTRKRNHIIESTVIYGIVLARK